jgi:hypothetical protein
MEGATYVTSNTKTTKKINAMHERNRYISPLLLLPYQK